MTYLFRAKIHSALEIYFFTSNLAVFWREKNHDLKFKPAERSDIKYDLLRFLHLHQHLGFYSMCDRKNHKH